MLGKSLRIASFISISIAIVPLCAQNGGEQPAPLGKLVDIGEYRLHLYCTGTGKQTVVLSPGGGDFSFDWYLVQQRVSKFARVCSYDRAGSAWSDPGPEPRTLKQEAYELHLALDRAKERGPYILVGHSMGGLVVRIFADLYPDAIGGMVLVDALNPDGTLGYNGKLTHMREVAQDRPIPEPQTMKTSPPKLLSDNDRKAPNSRRINPPYSNLPVEIQRLQLWAWSLPPRVAQGEDYLPDEMKDLYERSVSTPHPLGNRPLVSVIGTRAADKAPPGISPERWDALHQENIALKRAFRNLSTNSKVVEDKNAGHSVQLDDPDTVATAIQDVLRAAQQHTSLSP
jgi:pimeloyl-ACP methyl ester carboxylesterase